MKKFISDLLQKNVKLYTVLAYGAVALLGICIAYYFLPILLNYAPNSINTEFDKEFSSGFTYFMQFCLIYVVIAGTETIWLIVNMKDFYGLDTLVEDAKKSPKENERLIRVIKKCMKMPTNSFLLLIVLPSSIVTIAFIFLKFTSFADMKVLLVVLTLSMLAGTLTYIASKNIFKTILTNLNNTKIYGDTRISLTPSIMFQIVPVAIICILYTFLLSYSSSLEDKSSVLQKHYITTIAEDIEERNISSIDELMNYLNRLHFISDNDKAFLIDENGEFINFSNKTVSPFFRQYALTLAKKNNNRVYDYYGSETQGTLIPVEIDGNTLYIVIQYDLMNSNPNDIFFNILILLLLSTTVIFNFASSISKDISIVTASIHDLIEHKEDGITRKLSVTSSDELGDLLMAFNQVQELTQENITEIKNSEQSLMEKERLASLGEMIGGIAHNMKTPIMSIAGAAEGMTELIAEYRASIDNPQVTAEDHKEISQDMLDWVSKIKTHTSYMSDIITAVKGQASQLSASDYENFTLYDLSKQVEILIKHEIKKALLVLKIDIKCDPSVTLHGDINNLIQVINNLISNSIYAYNGQPDKVIKFTLDSDDENIILQVIDEGCGMSKEVQDKLFKQMYTTKGKNGTGLGLYMSYSTIKGKFNGNITFESEVDKGTTFTITIPRNVENA